MATKGPKTGAPKPAAPKPAARATKPAAPKAEAVAAEAEKPVPAPLAETIVPAPVAEPVPAAVAASQEAVNTIETAVESAVEATAEMAPTPAAAIEAVAAPIKETRIMETVENTTVKAQALFADMNERAKAAMEKSTKLVEEANEFAKGNLEAMVESGRIAAKGFESFGQEAAEYSRKQFEHATSVMKTLATVKSPTEFFKLQSDFMRGAFDSYVAEASKTTEAMLKLAGDAAQPLSNRIAVAVEKVKIAA